MGTQKARRGGQATRRRTAELLRRDTAGLSEHPLMSHRKGVAVLRRVVAIDLHGATLPKDHPLQTSLTRVESLDIREKPTVALVSAGMAVTLRKRYVGSQEELSEGIKRIVSRARPLTVQLGAAAIFGNHNRNNIKPVGYELVGDEAQRLHEQTQAIMSLYTPDNFHFKAGLAVSTTRDLDHALSQAALLDATTPAGITVTLGEAFSYNVSGN